MGRATALRLGSRGMAIAAADLDEAGARSTAKEIEDGGSSAAAVPMDVTDTESVTAGFKRTVSELGPIDVLVNCAGWDELRPFLETDEALWDKLIEINFKGCLRTTRAALPGMVERGWGRVVNIGSDAGRVGSSLESVYAGTKAAVIAFTKTIAREVARDGVTANSVCPGPTRTPLLDGLVEASEGGEKVIEAMTRAVPMKRLGEPEDVAAAIAFLVSEDAGYITGQTLSVSGGLTMA